MRLQIITKNGNPIKSILCLNDGTIKQTSNEDLMLNSEKEENNKIIIFDKIEP